MTSSRFVVRQQSPSTATRPHGAAARAKLRSLLEQMDQVTVDMADIVLTPSFADEFLGVLLAELGEAKFRQVIRIENVSPSARPLLQTVLQRRSAPAHPVQRSVHAHA